MYTEERRVIDVETDVDVDVENDVNVDLDGTSHIIDRIALWSLAFFTVGIIGILSILVTVKLCFFSG